MRQSSKPKTAKIEKVKSEGRWDIVLVPEDHPIVPAEVHEYNPNRFLIFKKALKEAVEAASPLFTNQTKHGLPPDTWNTMAVFAALRKWYDRTINAPNTDKAAEEIRRQLRRNLSPLRPPHQEVKASTKYQDIPAKLTVGEDEVMTEWDFWVNYWASLQQRIAQFEQQQMETEMLQAAQEADNMAKGRVQAMGGNPNIPKSVLMPKPTAKLPGTEEYGGAKPQPRRG